MKKITIILCSLAMVLGTVGTLNATSFTLASFDVSLNQSDPGLVVWWQPILSTPDKFELNNVGDFVTEELFKIGTNEVWSNSDDKIDKPISVNFIFSSPAFSATDSGITDGHTFFLASWGSVEWSDPVYINFGTTGQISIDLSNETFWTPGSATVSGTISLTKIDTPADITPVPEPETMLMLGSVLLGLVAVTRKRFNDRT